MIVRNSIERYFFRSPVECKNTKALLMRRNVYITDRSVDDTSGKLTHSFLISTLFYCFNKSTSGHNDYFQNQRHYKPSQKTKKGKSKNRKEQANLKTSFIFW